MPIKSLVLPTVSPLISCEKTRLSEYFPLIVILIGLDSIYYQIREHRWLNISSSLSGLCFVLDFTTPLKCYGYINYNNMVTYDGSSPI